MFSENFSKVTVLVRHSMSGRTSRSMHVRLRPSSYILRLPEVHLTLNVRNIPLVSLVKYLGIIFDERIA